MTGSVVAGRSRVAADPLDLHRAGAEHCWRRTSQSPDDRSGFAVAGVRGHRRLQIAAAGDERRPRRAGALLPDTIAPLVAYDEQYGTELVRRSKRFSPTTARWQTYKQLFTHRHTIRYRLDRVKS